MNECNDVFLMSFSIGAAAGIVFGVILAVWIGLYQLAKSIDHAPPPDD